MSSTKRIATFAALGACCVLVNTACDRSWRDENFVTPQGAGGNNGVEPPRVRPSPLPSATGMGPGPESGETVEDPNGTDTAPRSDDGDTETPNASGPRPIGSGGDGSSAPTRESTGEDGETGEGANSSPGQNTTDGENHGSADAVSSTANDPGESSEPAPAPFSKKALLRAASDCAVARYERFLAAAKELQSVVRSLDEDPASLIDAQYAFVDALLAFQRVEGFRVGPAARAMDPGGQDLRDSIYFYPGVNRCLVDRTLVSQAYTTKFDTVTANARGLAALEYLLYARGETNTCAEFADINVNGTWAALSLGELEARRSAYAEVVVNDVVERAQQLVDAWRPAEGNFVAQVEDAGDGSTVFATQQAALNAFSHALFYMEKEVKDYKLGWPLGIVAECTSGSCPYAAELPYSGLSGPSIRENLIAFRELFEGCGQGYSGVGFDDWLREVNPEDDLADRMLERLTTAQAVVADLSIPIEDAFYDEPEAATEVHAAIKAVTDLLKTEFVTVLNLELPMTSEGDND